MKQKIQQNKNDDNNIAWQQPIHTLFTYIHEEKEMNQERKNKTKETDIYFKRQ